ncbi:MAG: hypothetical protein US79_C0004G0042 [Parcubacteria group bacterium GW2011_GWC1_38_17]|nr:MAG: hypothetical protein US79_C0004G0042 [Parcubacteria group bacterium GW2011_GWC1_38_17]
MKVTLIRCAVCKEPYSCEYRRLNNFKHKHKDEGRACRDCELGKTKNDCSNLFLYDKVIFNGICEKCRIEYRDNMT